MKRRYNYFALLIGGVFLVITIGVVLDRIDFYRTSVVGEATVVRLNAGGNHPEIAFTALDGREYETPASSWWSVEQGQKVAVRYDPSEPRMTVVIDTFADIWWWTFFLAIPAVLFLEGGLTGMTFEKGGIR